MCDAEDEEVRRASWRSSSERVGRMGVKEESVVEVSEVSRVVMPSWRSRMARRASKSATLFSACLSEMSLVASSCRVESGTVTISAFGSVEVEVGRCLLNRACADCDCRIPSSAVLNCAS